MSPPPLPPLPRLCRSLPRPSSQPTSTRSFPAKPTHARTPSAERRAMAIEADPAARAAGSVSETAPMSPAASEAASASSAAAAGPARPRGWLRKLIPRDYHLPRSSRRWRLAAPSAAGASRLASSLSRSLRWKRLPGLSSLSLRSGSAAAVVDAVAFRVMYVVEAVVLGLALSCFFLCCGCHL